MSTTTIRLSQELKVRLKGAAQRAGTTAHGFILQAIAEKTEQAERRCDLEDSANRRYDKIVASGRTIAWPDLRRYLQARAAGKKAARPAVRKLAG